MNTLLSGSWLNVRKKEPEPLQEEEVINIVQQALDNPSANTSVKDCVKSNSGKAMKNEGTQVTAMQDKSSENTDSAADPKVAEFFKDFPDPYREKAIQRFSKRDGLYRFDFIRDQAMEHELSVAMKRGVFLEDRREQKERSKEKAQREIEKEIDDYVQKRRDGDIADWERKLRQYVPIADDEDPGWKLFNVANIAALSGLLLYRGIKSRHAPPNTERLRVYRRMAGHIGAAGIVGAGAVCRLMDWGPFAHDESGRDSITKIIEDSREDLRRLWDYVEGRRK